MGIYISYEMIKKISKNQTQKNDTKSNKQNKIRINNVGAYLLFGR